MMHTQTSGSRIMPKRPRRTTMVPRADIQKDAKKGDTSQADCCVQAVLGKKSLFWSQAYFLEKDLFWEHAYFWKERPIFGAHTTGGRKETCKKRRKNNIYKENQRGAQEDMPNHDRVRVFEKHCNNYKPIK
jgi:hypothetical protein